MRRKVGGFAMALLFAFVFAINARGDILRALLNTE
jgi:hypothetical protein